jgi:FkbM family methyltransferase
MIKKFINLIFNNFGYTIERVQKNNSLFKKSVRTTRLVYYETPTGNYYLPADAVKDIVANTIIRGEIFEEEIVNLSRKYIKSGTTVLDVGSNFGQMALLFARMVGEEGEVYAFEADDFVFEILKKNIAANNLSKIIKPIFGAVHDKTNEKLIYPEQDFVRFGSYGSYGIDYNAKKGREVETITIDSMHINNPISFMKIDIQGGDLFAIQGAIETIKKHKMPILFEYEYRFEDEFNMSFQDYVDLVTSMNYKFEKVIRGHNYLIVPK